MKVESGPEALKWIRVSSGLTQHELAARSGVSERTIRSLERGQVRKPHHASLRALVDAASISPLHRNAFLRAWRPDRTRSLGELTASDAPLEDIVAEAVLQTAIEQTVLYSWTRYVVTPNRTCTVHNRYVLEAQHDGLDSYALTIGHPQDTYPDIVATVDGATLVARHDVRDQNATVYELAFPRKLSRGEHFAFATSSTVTGLPVLAPGELDLAGRINHCSAEVLTVEVVFTESAPDTVWEFESPSGPESRHRRLRTHEVGADGRVRIIRRHAGPGLYGMEWHTPVSPANAGRHAPPHCRAG